MANTTWPGDYLARRGTITFPAGVTSKNVFVTVNRDYDAEAVETFMLAIRGSTGPMITRATGTGRRQRLVQYPLLIAPGALSRGPCYISRRRNQSCRVGSKNP